MILKYLVIPMICWFFHTNFLVRGDTQSLNIRNESPPFSIEEIIKKFAAKEEEFRQARDNYTYRQTVEIKVLTLNGGRTGERYFTESDILFDNRGKRIEKVLRAPQSTLRSIQLTQEDLDDIQNIFPFVLTTSSISKYNLHYLGKELIDEIHTFVFDVSPRVIKKRERYFEGKIWVDDQDLQIVKTNGRTVYRITKHNRDQRFPKFETYRENIDGQYWFPTYTRADDVLRFPGQNVRIREIVTYKKYKRFKADVKITVGDEVPSELSK